MPRVATGLCDSCRHQRIVRSGRGSEFSLCELYKTDPSFPKYPRLPVLECSGYRRRGLEESQEIRDAWVAFCERLSAGDVDAFDDVVSAEAKLIIGTAPGEWVDDRPRMRFGFETEGVTLTPGAPRAHAEGSLGWIVDEPDFGFPDGSVMKPRVTAVLRHEDGAWKLVHAHFSVGVPDDEVVDLQKRWAGG